MVCSNLKIDDKGELHIKDFPISKYAYIELIGSNGVRNINQIIPLKDTSIATRPLTLRS